MAKENQKELEIERQEKVVKSVSKIEKFFNDNQKTIYGVLCAIIVIGLAVLAYQKFYLQPKKAEALAQLYPAEASFRSGEYDLALNGDGNVAGFAQIIKDYGKKAGAAVYLYAGVCELEAGNWQSALDYLKKYDGKEPILAARALAATGDAYVGLEDYKAALGYFEKAAAKADNMFAATYLLKAAQVCEELGDTDKALTLYKQIKEKYPQSIEGYDVDKYISRINSK